MDNLKVGSASAMSLNLVVPKVINLRIEWFHIINSHKSSGSIEPLSKIKWFHGTTGTTTNADPDILAIPTTKLNTTLNTRVGQLSSVVPAKVLCKDVVYCKLHKALMDVSISDVSCKIHLRCFGILL